MTKKANNAHRLDVHQARLDNHLARINELETEVENTGALLHTAITDQATLAERIAVLDSIVNAISCDMGSTDANLSRLDASTAHHIDRIDDSMSRINRRLEDLENGPAQRGNAGHSPVPIGFNKPTLIAAPQLQVGDELVNWGIVEEIEGPPGSLFVRTAGGHRWVGIYEMLYVIRG